MKIRQLRSASFTSCTNFFFLDVRSISSFSSAEGSHLTDSFLDFVGGLTTLLKESTTTFAVTSCTPVVISI
ncbi:MAG: hypothetical protein ACK56I_14780, partial [bacterium]